MPPDVTDSSWTPGLSAGTGSPSPRDWPGLAVLLLSYGSATASRTEVRSKPDLVGSGLLTLAALLIPAGSRCGRDQRLRPRSNRRPSDGPNPGQGPRPPRRSHLLRRDVTWRSSVPQPLRCAAIRGLGGAGARCRVQHQSVDRYWSRGGDRFGAREDPFTGQRPLTRPAPVLPKGAIEPATQRDVKRASVAERHGHNETSAGQSALSTITPTAVDDHSPRRSPRDDHSQPVGPVYAHYRST